VLDLWTDLLCCLQLRAQDGSEFEGDSQRLNYHRVFGGQLLGQFIRAASMTCPGHLAYHLVPPGRSAPITGYCCASPAQCWRTVAVLAAATSLPEDGSLVASYAQEALLRFRDA